MPGVRTNARMGRALFIAALAFQPLGLSWLAADLAAQAVPLPDPWLRIDLGNPGPAGTSSVDQGTFNITLGDSRSSSSDHFHFVYQPFSGNVEVTARADSVFLSSQIACSPFDAVVGLLSTYLPIIAVRGASHVHGMHVDRLDGDQRTQRPRVRTMMCGTIQGCTSALSE
jgi:hypothetical protein